MREPGVQSPKSIISKIIYWITRYRFKKVLLPVKIHALSPSRLFGFGLMTQLQTKPRFADPQLILLGQARVGAMVGCPF